MNQLVQKEEKQILLDNGNDKLFLKGGPTKVKLEDISMSQWVTGAIHIFNHLMEGNKFASIEEMQSYLGYLVKGMELARKFE